MQIAPDSHSFLAPFIRRLFFCISIIILSWTLTDVLLHRSTDASILGIYSLSYFVWVFFYSAFYLCWVGISLYAFFFWESLVSRIQQAALRSGWLPWIWCSLPLPWATILAFSTWVGKYASDTTPHSAFVPLALAAVAACAVAVIVLANPRQGVLAPTSGGQTAPLDEPSGFPQLTRQALRSQWSTHAAIVGLIVVPLPFMLPVLLDNTLVLGGHDTRGLYYIVENYVTSSIQNGVLPLWNPYLFSGTPLLGRPDSMLFYPLVLAMRFFLPTAGVVNWAYAIHIWIAGLSMFALARHIGLAKWISFGCSLVYMLNGGLVTRVYAGHIWLVIALAWLPAIWVLLMIAVERKSWLAFAGAAICLALTILSGHPTYPGYTLMMMGLYVIYAGFVNWGLQKPIGFMVRAGFVFAGVTCLALGLAAVQLAPSLQFAGQSSLSGGYDVGGANLGALLPENLSQILLPDAYTHPGQGIWEQMPYLGILIPLAAPWALAGRRKPLAIFLGVIATFSVILAFGAELRVFSFFYQFVPPFRVMRVPARALVMWIPCVILLGGLGLQALAEGMVRRDVASAVPRLLKWAALVPITMVIGYLCFVIVNAPKNTLTITTPLFAAATAGVWLVCGQWLIFEYWTLARLKVMRVFAMVASLAASFAFGFIVLSQTIPSGTDLLRVTLGFGKLSLCLWCVGYAFASLSGAGNKLLPRVLVITLLAFDIYSFAWPYFPFGSIPQFDQAQLAEFGDIAPWPAERFMAGDTGLGDKPMLLNLGNIDGYASGMLSDYTFFLRGVSSNPPLDTVVLLSNTSFPNVDRRALNFLGVSHVLSKKPLIEPGYVLTMSTPELYLYRNLFVMPNAVLVNKEVVATDRDAALAMLLNPSFDYATTVVLTRPTGLESTQGGAGRTEVVDAKAAEGYIRFSTDSSAPSILVTNEPFYAERIVYVDGKPSTALKADIAFISVSLPAGRHTVEIGYSTATLKLGLSITVTAALIVASLTLYGFLKGRSAHDLAANLA